MDTPSSVSSPDLRKQITHEELMQLPIIRYSGPIHVVKSAEELEAALNAIRAEAVVGLDTETRPTFHKGQSYSPTLVQIGTSRAVYLFQLAQLDCSTALASVLGNAHVTKAGIALDRDLIELKKLFPFEAAKIVDLGDIAKHCGYAQSGVRNLTGLFLGGRITKGAQTSNWAQPHLSQSQLIYAATDAWICRELYLKFDTLGLLKIPIPPKVPKAPKKTPTPDAP
jgi:ribonuclease D